MDGLLGTQVGKLLEGGDRLVGKNREEEKRECLCV